MKKRKRKVIHPKIVQRGNKRSLLDKSKQRLLSAIFNKITIPLFAGLIIGIIFGLSALHIVKQKGTSEPFTEAPATYSQKTEPASSEDTIPLQIELPPLYVVQIGVFNEYENAEASRRELASDDVASYVWERDSAYYVLHDVYRTEEAALTKQEDLEEKAIPSMVKSWEIMSDNLNIMAGEEKWFDQYITLWQQSFNRLEEGEAPPVEKWEILLNENTDSQRITAIQEKGRDIIPTLQSSSEKRTALLSLISLLEQLSSS